jgi:hypothetical protein
LELTAEHRKPAPRAANGAVVARLVLLECPWPAPFLQPGPLRRGERTADRCSMPSVATIAADRPRILGAGLFGQILHKDAFRDPPDERGTLPFAVWGRRSAGVDAHEAAGRRGRGHAKVVRPAPDPLSDHGFRPSTLVTSATDPARISRASSSDATADEGRVARAGAVPAAGKSRPPSS